MENKHVVSGLIGIAIIGALAGLVLENMIEGDAAKFRQFANQIKDNTLILFETAQMATVQNMISHATVALELSTAISDPDLIPNNGDEYILNQVSECVFYSPDDIPFPTCLICQLSDEECKEKIVCPVCARPTIFTVLYENPDQVQGDVVNIDVTKGNQIKKQFFGVTHGMDLEIDAQLFPNGNPGDTTPTNTEYHIFINNVETVITIHTSCSDKNLFVGVVHLRDSNSGDPNVSLTIVSGFDQFGSPTIPDASCIPPTEEECPECKRPFIFTVAYNGPEVLKINLYDKELKENEVRDENDAILMPVLVDGEIVVKADDTLDKKGNPNTKLPANLFYEIKTVSGTEEIRIHVSCSEQPFFVGQVYPEGGGDITLTIVSGTDADLNPTIPDTSCEETNEGTSEIPGANVLLEGKKILPDGYVAGTIETIPLPTGPDHPENDVQDISCVKLLVCGKKPPQYRTQTPGGWGQVPNGNNVGAYRELCYDDNIAPVIIGDMNILFEVDFTSSAAIEAYLPDGGPPAILSQSETNPTSINDGNNLAAHTTALSINVAFDNFAVANPNDVNCGFDAWTKGADRQISDPSLADLVFVTATNNDGSELCDGMSVQEVLDEANKELADGSSSFTPSELTTCASIINNNYIDGTTDMGFLAEP